MGTLVHIQAKKETLRSKKHNEANNASILIRSCVDALAKACKYDLQIMLMLEHILGTVKGFRVRL